jgi:hypothetical protein
LAQEEIPCNQAEKADCNRAEELAYCTRVEDQAGRSRAGEQRGCSRPDEKSGCAQAEMEADYIRVLSEDGYGRRESRRSFDGSTDLRAEDARMPGPGNRIGSRWPPNGDRRELVGDLLRYCDEAHLGTARKQKPRSLEYDQGRGQSCYYWLHTCPRWRRIEPVKRSRGSYQ